MEIAAAAIGVIGGLVGGVLIAFLAQGLATKHDADVRKRERGVAAAAAIVEEMHKADLAYFSIWRRYPEGERKDAWPPGPHARQADLQATYMALRRHTQAIPDDRVRRIGARLADAVYYYDGAAWESSNPREVWAHLLIDAEAVFGAYEREQDVPEPTYLDQIERDYKAYADMQRDDSED